MKKKINVFLTALFAVILAFTCATPSPDSGSNGGGTTGSPAGGGTTVAVTGITLIKDATYTTVSGAETLYAEITPANATNQSLTWTSSDATKATVDSTGKITGVSAGTSTITVKTADGGFTDTCAVTVAASAKAVTGVTLNKSSTTIASGSAERLTAEIAPLDATNQNISWTTSPESKATVSSFGLVTGVSSGDATITVTTADGGFTDTCSVTITDTVAPADVSNLASVSGDTQITLSWDEPADADYDHVEITYGSTTLTVAKGTTTRTITGLTNGTSYTFTVKSVDTSGNKSSGVSTTTSPADTTPPANVTGLTATAGNTEVTLNWTAPADADFASVEITSSPVTSTYTVAKGTNTRTITGLTNGTSYTFTVKSVDTTGNKSTGVTASATPAEFTNGCTSSTATLTNDVTIIGVTGVTSAQGGVTLQGRTVYLSDFWIAQTETTYAQWKEVYDWALLNGYNFANAGWIGSSNSGSTLQPVTYINWRDTIVWCNALSEKEGLTPCYTYVGSVIRDSRDTNATACDNAALTLSNSGYRLPTEAEWEYAARGGYDSATYPNAPWNYTYSGSNTVGNVSWYNFNSGSTTHNVGIDKVSGVNSANALVLYDMSGNVFEWCYDWYGSIGTTAETDPLGAASGSPRVIRGGACYHFEFYSRVDSRISYIPYSDYHVIGFRPARSR